MLPLLLPPPPPLLLLLLLPTQAFEQPGGPMFWWTMPTEVQLRVQAYTAVVLGAAGIIYFALDSWVTRVGDVVGEPAQPGHA